MTNRNRIYFSDETQIKSEWCPMMYICLSSSGGCKWLPSWKGIKIQTSQYIWFCFTLHIKQAINWSHDTLHFLADLLSITIMLWWQLNFAQTHNKRMIQRNSCSIRVWYWSHVWTLDSMVVVFFMKAHISCLLRSLFVQQVLMDQTINRLQHTWKSENLLWTCHSVFSPFYTFIFILLYLQLFTSNAL